MDLLAVGIALPWVVGTLGCYVGYRLVEQNRRMIERLERIEDMVDDMGVVHLADLNSAHQPDALPLDSPAPPFELRDLDGRPVSLEQFRGQRLALIFFSPQCGYCMEMLPFMTNLPAEGRDGGPIPVVITRGDLEENRHLPGEHGLRCRVLLDAQGEVATAYRAHGTPTGYLISEQGTIASGLMTGAAKVLGLTEPGWVPEQGDSTEGGGTKAFLGMPSRLSLRDGNGKVKS